jgi:hypothetical protein
LPSAITLNGTMPPSTRRPGKRLRSTAVLPTPFCRLTTTQSGGACRAIISPIAAVSALLTVTSITAASLTIEGCSDSANWFAAMVRSKPSKLVGRRPFASISPMTRERASSATRRPPATSIPPTKQPILPAPAIAIVRPAFICCSPRCIRLR